MQTLNFLKLLGQIMNSCTEVLDPDADSTQDASLIVKPDVHPGSVNHVFDPTTRLSVPSKPGWQLKWG